MSQFETELRQRVSRGDDIYDTYEWYLAAIGAEEVIDGGRPAPDLSLFEREFLIDNMEYHGKQKLRRMSMSELLNGAATARPHHPEHEFIDMCGLANRTLIRTMFDRTASTRRYDSAVAELTKRANAKGMPLADFIDKVTEQKRGDRNIRKEYDK
jgi:hypothetical protein